MKSGWLINFKNGYKVILSERLYERHKEETPKEDIDTEEHWFVLDKLIEKYPEIDFFD